MTSASDADVVESRLNALLAARMANPKTRLLKMPRGGVVRQLAKEEPKALVAGDPGNWTVEMVDTTAAPFNANPLCYYGQGLYQNYFLDQQYVLSYFGRGSVSYQGSSTLIVFVMDPGNWPAAWGPPVTTVRYILPVLGGNALCVAVPKGVSLEPGLTWEKTCFNMGWWFQDPPGILDPAKIPPGPNYGELGSVYLLPNVPLAVWALVNNVPDWWNY